MMSNPAALRKMLSGVGKKPADPDLLGAAKATAKKTQGFQKRVKAHDLTNAESLVVIGYSIPILIMGIPLYWFIIPWQLFKRWLVVGRLPGVATLAVLAIVAVGSFIVFVNIIGAFISNAN